MEECLGRRGVKDGALSPRHLLSSAIDHVIAVISMISNISLPYYDLSRSESRSNERGVYQLRKDRDSRKC